MAPHGSAAALPRDALSFKLVKEVDPEDEDPRLRRDDLDNDLRRANAYLAANLSPDELVRYRLERQLRLLEQSDQVARAHGDLLVKVAATASAVGLGMLLVYGLSQHLDPVGTSGQGWVAWLAGGVGGLAGVVSVWYAHRSWLWTRRAAKLEREIDLETTIRALDELQRRGDSPAPPVGDEP